MLFEYYPVILTVMNLGYLCRNSKQGTHKFWFCLFMTWVMLQICDYGIDLCLQLHSPYVGKQLTSICPMCILSLLIRTGIAI